MKVQQLELSADTLSACFSPDGKLLASPGRKASNILSVGDERVLYPLEGALGSAIAFRPGTTEIAMAVPARNAVRRLQPDCVVNRISVSRPFRVAYSPDGKFLASGNSLGQVQVWNVEKDEAREVSSVDLTREPVCSLAFNADATVVYATLTTGESFEVNVAEKQEKPLHCEQAPSMEWYTVAAHPTLADLAVFAGVGKQVWMRNRKENRWTNADNEVGESIRHLSFCGDKLIAVGSNGVQVFVLNGERLNPYQPWHRESDKHRILAAVIAEGELLVARMIV